MSLLRINLFLRLQRQGLRVRGLLLTAARLRWQRGPLQEGPDRPLVLPLVPVPLLQGRAGAAVGGGDADVGGAGQRQDVRAEDIAGGESGLRNHGEENMNVSVFSYKTGFVCHGDFRNK